MSSLFGSLPSAGLRHRSFGTSNRAIVPAGAATDPGAIANNTGAAGANGDPGVTGNGVASTANRGTTGSFSSGEPRALQWVYDEETAHCMHCNTPFTLLTRKHHCRRCGKVVCKNCSPHKCRIHINDPFPMRVCNTCYAAVDEHYNSLEWSGHGSADIQGQPDPVIEGRVHIGQVYVKVVEAIGLPSTDSITSDPFVRVKLTGKWSHGQEWGNDLRSVKCTKRKSRTLNPRWHESFVFNVCAPGAELVFEVYNYGQLSQPTKLGEAVVPLSQVMDQRRHNKWLDLLLPEKLHRVGLNNDMRAGRLHVLLHYKFSRLAEFCSYFYNEQEFVHKYPEFKAALIYNNFWVLLDHLWPYLEMIWQIVPTLSWEHPTYSLLCFALCIWLCLSIEWVPVVIHLMLIAYCLRNYFEISVQSFGPQMAGKDHDEPSSTSPSSTTFGIGGGNAVGGVNGGAASGVNGSSSGMTYSLPTGFNHLMNKMTHVTIDAETKQALQAVQNGMAWWSNILSSIELLFSWEDTFYTSKVLLVLIISCLLHIVIPNKYILLGFVVYLFAQFTVPFLWMHQVLRALRRAVQSFVHQQRVSSLHEQPDLLSTSGRDVLLVSTSQDSAKAASLNRAKKRRNPSNLSVSKKEEMFASALSQRFVEESEKKMTIAAAS